MYKNKIKQEIKNVFKTSHTITKKDYAKADFIKKLWLTNYYNMEAANDSEREKSGFNENNFDILRFIGEQICKEIKNNAYNYIQLVKVLWESYGKEGRTLTPYILKQIIIEKPDETLLFIKELVKKCNTYEECDNIAIKSIEPVVMNDIDKYIGIFQIWLNDKNKWVKRLAIIIISRISMKKITYADQCLDSLKVCFDDNDVDVMRSLSMGLRLIARGKPVSVKSFISSNINNNYTNLWIFTDFIIKLNKKYLTDFKELFNVYSSVNKQNIDEKLKVMLADTIELLKQ